jgi:protoheme IX farnesyltransferase
MVNADYTRAKVPMLPVVAGTDATKLQIVQYTVVLTASTVALGMLAPLGWGYALTALGLGVWWQVSTVRLMFAAGAEGAQTVFTRSLYYLAFVFLAMVVFSFV